MADDSVNGWSSTDVCSIGIPIASTNKSSVKTNSSSNTSTHVETYKGTVVPYQSTFKTAT